MPTTPWVPNRAKPPLTEPGDFPGVERGTRCQLACGFDDLPHHGYRERHVAEHMRPARDAFLGFKLHENEGSALHARHAGAEWSLDRHADGACTQSAYRQRRMVHGTGSAYGSSAA